MNTGCYSLCPTLSSFGRVLDQFFQHVSGQSFFFEVSLLFRSTSSAISVVSRVSAGSVRCAIGSRCCGEEGRGGRRSGEPGRCTGVHGCSAQKTDTWPLLSAASPPSSGLRSLSRGSRSPGNTNRQNIFEHKGGMSDLPLQSNLKIILTR